ncbi:MAG: glycosyltransferase family 39 protein [Candidatus Hydrogenedentes bacterium]|nr:glycosyltransferase family 39 protein [Candidatus Hydrogenedentota bacterium]
MISLSITSVVIAWALLRVLALPRTLESYIAATLAGLCIQSAGLLAIGSVNLVAAQLATLLVALGGIAFAVYRLLHGQSLLVPVPFRPARGFIGVASIVAMGAAFAAIVVSARAPATSWDAGVAHLALPAEYARAGRIVAVPGNNYSAYPQLVHTLFAAAPGSLEKESAQLAWFFGLLLCGGASFLALRIGGERCAVVAPAIISTTPLFLEQCPAPGIDVPYTATVIGALGALAAWKNDRRTGWLLLAGILAGSGCGIRHTAYLVNAMLLFGVLLLSDRRRLRDSAIFSGTMVVCAAPWLVRTAVVSGNPVYPFFSSVLGANAAPDVDVAAIGAHSSIQGSGLLQLLAFPWSLTMNPAHYGGWSTSPGALWLVLGVIGVIVGGRAAHLLGAFGVAGLIAIFFFQRFARYAFPFLAPLMVVASLPVEKLPALRRVTGAALVVSYALGLAPSLAGAALKLPVALGIEPREAYLAARVERFPAMAWAAATFPKDAVVLSLDPRGYYLDRSAHTNFEALKGIASGDAESQRAWLRENRIGYLLYPNKYVTDSPAFRETGVGAMVDAWRADMAHFTLIKEFELPNPRDGGTERVEFYEFKP